MKKILFAIAIIFVLSLETNAQRDGFLGKDSNWNDSYRETPYDDVPMFPNSHGTTNNIEAPLGSGLLILTALGGAYAITRKKR